MVPHRVYQKSAIRADQLPLIKKFIRVLYRNRSVKFTKEGTRFVLLSLGVGVAAINTGNNLLYMILAMMLSFIIVSGILSEQCIRKINVRRKISFPLYAGTPFQVDLVVCNAKRFFPSFSLQVQDTLPDKETHKGSYFFIVKPKGEVRGHYSLVLPDRGHYKLETIQIHTRFPFGLFIKTLTYPLENALVVYPKIEPITPTLIPFSQRRDGEEINQKGQGTTLYQLRAFQDGDDARSIHWKTSARHRRLLIRENETEAEKRVILFLDNRWSGNTHPEDAKHFEKAVSLTASLSSHFIKRGFAVELISANTHFPFAKGPQHLQKILYYLALVTPHFSENPLPLTNRTLQDYRFLILGHKDELWNGKDGHFTRVFNSPSMRKE